MKRNTLILLATLTTVLATSLPAFALTAAEQTKLTTIITKGDQEIARRTTSINAAAIIANETTKLPASDVATLKNELSTTLYGLTALKAKLDADTTLVDARTDAKSIVTEYRVYALMLPKAHLVKVADGQIALEAKFETLSTQFMQRFSELKAEGKDTASLEATLSNMNMKVSSASKLSTATQSAVIILQPSDYNSDHTILVGYRDQLKSAHDSLVSARGDATSINAGIKSLVK